MLINSVVNRVLPQSYSHFHTAGAKDEGPWYVNVMKEAVFCFVFGAT